MRTPDESIESIAEVYSVSLDGPRASSGQYTRRNGSNGTNGAHGTGANGANGANGKTTREPVKEPRSEAEADAVTASAAPDPEVSTPAPSSAVPAEKEPAPPVVVEAKEPPAPNYVYWQENGEGWADEYDQRKRRQPMYHVQELMLAEYMQHHAPAKVLEFGCGVGRHLSYLSRMAGIEVHGFDQSPTMVSQVSRWADPSFIAERIRVGDPVGRLPYEDKSFDVVYTAEVLVHVRPEHLLPILRELVRICRGQIIHLETSEHYELHAEAHQGCWKHDLVSAYHGLGLPVEVLPSGYRAHTPVRVLVGGESPRFTWSPVVMNLCRRLERDLSSGISEAEARATKAETERTRGVAEAKREAESAEARRTHEAAASAARVQQLQDALDRRNADAEKLKSVLNDAQSRASNLALQIEPMRAAARERDGLRSELEAARAAQSRLSADLEQATAELARLRAEHESATAAARVAAERSASAWQEERSTLTERISSLEARIEQLRASLGRQIRVGAHSAEAQAKLAEAHRHDASRVRAVQERFIAELGRALPRR